MHVDPLMVFIAQSQLLRTGENLSGESFVQFDQVDIFEGKTGIGERFLSCRHRANPHRLGLYTGERPAYHSAHRLQTVLFRRRTCRHDTSRSAVILP